MGKAVLVTQERDCVQALFMVLWLVTFVALILAVVEREKTKPNGWITTLSFIGIAMYFYLGGTAINLLF